MDNVGPKQPTLKLKPVFVDFLIYPVYRRLGGESKPGNLNGFCVRDPVAGLWTAISGPAPSGVPFGVGVLTLLRNESKSGSVRSWMIPGGS